MKTIAEERARGVKFKTIARRRGWRLINIPVVIRDTSKSKQTFSTTIYYNDGTYDKTFVGNRASGKPMFTLTKQGISHLKGRGFKVRNIDRIEVAMGQSKRSPERALELALKKMKNVKIRIKENKDG